MCCLSNTHSPVARVKTTANQPINDGSPEACGDTRKRKPKKHSPSWVYPTLKKQSRIYCVCQNPNDGRQYWQCDNCPEWYHPECIDQQKGGEVPVEFLGPCCETTTRSLKNSDSDSDSSGFVPPFTPRRRLTSEEKQEIAENVEKQKNVPFQFIDITKEQHDKYRNLALGLCLDKSLLIGSTAVSQSFLDQALDEIIRDLVPQLLRATEDCDTLAKPDYAGHFLFLRRKKIPYGMSDPIFQMSNMVRTCIDCCLHEALTSYKREDRLYTTIARIEKCFKVPAPLNNGSYPLNDYMYKVLHNFVAFHLLAKI